MKAVAIILMIFGAHMNLIFVLIKVEKVFLYKRIIKVSSVMLINRSFNNFDDMSLLISILTPTSKHIHRRPITIKELNKAPLVLYINTNPWVRNLFLSPSLFL
jgi:hypothetical protein